MGRPPKGDSLGLDRAISRRDFVGGVAASGALLACPLGSRAADAATPGTPCTADPSALTGLRGTPPGSFEVAHAMRDRGHWRDEAIDSGESYDLVVVGAGLGGLATAHFYRQIHGPAARILILDPQDDFGGHARRNTFDVRGRRLIGYGGTEQLYPGPGAFSARALQVLIDTGVDFEVFATGFDQNLYPSLGLQEALFFDRATFGANVLLTGEGQSPSPEFIHRTPLTATAKADLIRLYTHAVDYLPGLSVAEKLQRLERTSYARYLLDTVKVNPAVLPYFDSRVHGYEVVGIDATPALSAWVVYGMPGFAGLGLPTDPQTLFAMTQRSGGVAGAVLALEDRIHASGRHDPPEIFHFPDGNASVARALVRALIPAAVPARTSAELPVATVCHARLDEDGSPTRLRLGATVVRAQETAKSVEVRYVARGRTYSVRSRHCVLACYQAIAPYICPDMPQQQREIIHEYAVRAPLMYTNVAVRNWKAWTKLGIHHVHALAGFHSTLKLDYPVSLGEYRFPRTPDEPMVIMMKKSMVRPGLSRRQQHRAGRADLLALDFPTIERHVREQLNDVLGPGGFDSARDIEAITVNRWPHGYAPFGRDSLVDPEWPEGQSPWDIARRPLGRITIAGSDAAPMPLTQAAFDQAWRAVSELPRT